MEILCTEYIWRVRSPARDGDFGGGRSALPAFRCLGGAMERVKISMDLLSSNSFLMLEKSLGYLWTKQAAIADNVSNAETPGYKEKVVTFEDSLKSKLVQASRRTAPVKEMRQVLETTPFSVTEQTVQTRMDDNGVNVTAQMSEAIRNAFQMRYVMSSINSELAVLRSAVRGQ